MTKSKNDRDVETSVTRWLIPKDTELYQKITRMLVSRNDKCLNFGGACNGGGVQAAAMWMAKRIF